MTAADLAVAVAFTQGFTYALSEGGQLLRATLYEQAANEILANLEGTIAKRAEAAGVARAHDVVALQTKRDAFQQRLALATGEDRVKYQAYVDCLNWMLTPNGH